MTQTVKNILRGAASITAMLPPSDRPELKRLYAPQNDYDAIRSDWEKVGSDLRTAFNRLSHVR